MKPLNSEHIKLTDSYWAYRLESERGVYGLPGEYI